MENKQLLNLINRWFDIAIVMEAALIIAGIASLHIVTFIISMIFLILLPFSLIKKSVPGLMASFLIHVTVIFFLRSRFFFSDSIFQLWLTICIFYAGFSAISYYLGRKLKYLEGLEGYPYFNEMTDEQTGQPYPETRENDQNKFDKIADTIENKMINETDGEKADQRKITADPVHVSMEMDCINTDNLDTGKI